jgi:alpha-L-fucosidase
MKIRLLALVLFLFSCARTEYPDNVHPLPSARQLAWHELEYYAFVHFNMNTFTNKEWGYGDESPELFNPTELDCRQWARVCRDAGMKGIILTAKHHDGFCLWPSAYTEHSVKNSPWKNGQGDVVRELAEACEEYGLKFGVYLSPWDRNHPDYGKPEYLDYFRNQLRELLTNYGEVFEVWFDGANGGTGWYGGADEERRIDRETYYDWENTYAIVRELQPNACLFSDAGPDIRWVGNEEGWAMETNWAPLRRDEFYPGSPRYVELRSGHEDGTHWVPAEVDVSIRPGWYYHPAEDHKVKTLPHLLDIYYNSIGRNASFLLNFPVDTRGLIHENDELQVLKLAETIKADFADNLAKGQKFTASNTRGNSRKFKAGNVNDGNSQTSWVTDDGITNASLEIDFKKHVPVNRFLVQEDIRYGQRVKKFKLEALVNNEWQLIADQTTIGRKRILRFPDVTVEKLKFTIEDAKASPVISNIEVYHAPKVLVEPAITRTKNGMVELKAFDEGIHIYYTTDGTIPDENAIRYESAFEWKQKGMLKAVVFDPASGKSSPVSEERFDVVKEKWQLQGDYASNGDRMIDGNPNTAWVTSEKAPVDVIIDLGEHLELSGFTYLPDQGRGSPGIIFQYEFSVGTDGKNWKVVSEGEFSNIKNSPVLQEKKFAPVSGNFIKLRALSPAEENGRMGIAEMGVITN